MQSFDVGIDDFLINLRELARWPENDDDIRWDTALLNLVEGNAADAEVVGTKLSHSGTTTGVDLGAPSGDAWSLTEFQRRDITKLLALRHGANFSVPGAGKTRVALANFQSRRAAGEVVRMLVVCPKSAFESWQTEAEHCFEGTIRLAVMDGTPPPSLDILLVNYERIVDSQGLLLSWMRTEPTLLVLDEAHRMKLGPAGAWGAACLTLGPYAKRRLILSGTPAPNGVRDLENLFNFVWPGLGVSAVRNAVSGGDLRNASNQLRPLFVRTTKSELNLPPVDRVVRRVELPPIHRELYDALLGQASGKWRGGERDVESLGRVLMYLLMAATTPALLATGASRHEPLPYRVPPIQPPPGSTLETLMRDLPHYEMSPKYQEVLKIVSDNAHLGRKTLVWSTFVRNLSSLELLLKAFQPALVHGQTEDRPDQLMRFREDEDCMVLLSNPATLGEGVSLHQVCHDAVYVDRDFAAGRFMQSLDRIHRLGLPHDARTTVTALIADGTIDELVEDRLASKLRFMGGILDDPAVLELSDLDEEPTASAGMDAADVQALIEYLAGHAPR